MDIELERTRVVSDLLGKIQSNFPDAKKFKVNICFEFVEASSTQEDELCPNVSIEIER